VGGYVKSKKEGKGLFGYHGGQMYDVGWKNDKKEGQGILVDETGRRM